MHVSRTEPGLIVSAAAHVTLLAAALIAFNSPAKFQEAQESIPVEMITDQAFSQISKGEKTAKEVKPLQKADKVADLQEQRPTPPIAEAKKDVPLPPPPLKRIPDPGEDEDKKPEPQKTAALPPPRPVEQSKPAPEPPKPPTPPKSEAKEEPKDEPDKAETIAPKPPVRPKIEAKSEPKPAPPAPKPPEKPRLQTDEVAKLLARTKSDDKPSSRPKSGEENDEPRNKLDLTAISKLLDKDKPQARGSTGREVVHTASLGTATGTSTRMSPNMMDALNSLMMEQYMRCWNYFGTGAVHKYVPQVRVNFTPEGRLSGEPVLLNPTSDPAFASLASAALGAARKCDPMKIPAQFAPYYEQWKSRVIAFDPEEMR